MIGSVARGIAGLERLAQTEVRQDAADYNRCLGKWKDYLPFTSTGVLPPAPATQVATGLPAACDRLTAAVIRNPLVIPKTWNRTTERRIFSTVLVGLRPYISIRYRGARCLICTTMHNNAGLSHSQLTQCIRRF